MPKLWECHQSSSSPGIVYSKRNTSIFCTKRNYCYSCHLKIERIEKAQTNTLIKYYHVPPATIVLFVKLKGHHISAFNFKSKTEQDRYECTTGKTYTHRFHKVS